MYTILHVRLSKYIFQQQQNNKIHKGNLLMKKEKNALTCLPSSGRTPPVRWFHFDPDKYKQKCLVIHTPVLTLYMYLSTVYPFQIYPVSDGNIGNIPLPFILSYFICIFFIIIVLSSKVYPFYNLKNGEYIFHS